MSDITYDFEKNREKDIAKLGEDVSEWVKFMKRGIQIQNEAWDLEYACRKYDYTMSILHAVGMPDEMMKELIEAHNDALEQIQAHLRNRPAKKPRIPNYGKYDVVDIRKMDDGHIYITVRIKSGKTAE